MNILLWGIDQFPQPYRILIALAVDIFVATAFVTLVTAEEDRLLPDSSER